MCHWIKNVKARKRFIFQIFPLSLMLNKWSLQCLYKEHKLKSVRGPATACSELKSKSEAALLIFLMWSQNVIMLCSLRLGAHKSFALACFLSVHIRREQEASQGISRELAVCSKETRTSSVHYASTTFSLMHEMERFPFNMQEIGWNMKGQWMPLSHHRSLLFYLLFLIRGTYFYRHNFI